MTLGTLSRKITFLGCGKLNSAVLEGILSSSDKKLEDFKPPSNGGNGNGKLTDIPFVVNPQALIACVHKEHSAALLKQKFGHANIVTVLAKDNVQGVEQGDIIILGVEPSVYRNVLAEPGMRAALKNKTLVSIVGGVSTQKLQDAIFGQTSITEDEKRNHCHIVRVTPSTAAAVHESVSLISVEDDRHHPPPILNAVYSLFLRVGQVKLWPEELQPAGATLIAGSLAFLSVGLEGLVKSAIREGIEEDDALKMASAALLGLSKLIAAGETPEEVRKKVATRGGSTAAGLKVLEDGGVEKHMNDALRVATEKMSRLGDSKE